MSFQSPTNLWLLLLLVPAVAFAFARHTPDGVIPSHLLYKGTTKGLNRRLVARLCMVLAMLFLIVALACPYGGNSGGEVTAVLLMDLSGSMEARGIKDHSLEPSESNLTRSRLEEARSLALQMVDSLPNFPLGLVAFARRAYLVSPVTRHHETLRERMAALEILEYEDGTAIGEALICACRTLEHLPGERNIYLITDGADHSEGTLLQKAQEELRASGIRLYPLVVGKEYAYHSRREANGNLTWQANGEKPDLEMLERLARETGGEMLSPENIHTKTHQERSLALGTTLWCCLALCCLIMAGVVLG